MTVPLTFESLIEKSQIFDIIKKCIKPDGGFYLKRSDGSTLLITHTPNNNNFDQTKCEKIPDVVKACFLASNVQIHEGLKVYYARYLDEEGVFMCHTGHISSIKNEDIGQTFTIDGSQVVESSGSPVFTFNKTTRLLGLIGAITSTNRVVHSDFFKSSETKASAEQDALGEPRGKTRISVEFEQLKGIEQGQGKGHRSIQINVQEAVGVNPCYTLRYALNGKELNVHDCKPYNKNQSLLYQTALETFAAPYKQTKQVPLSFNFECYKSCFIAHKE